MIIPAAAVVVVVVAVVVVVVVVVVVAVVVVVVPAVVVVVEVAAHFIPSDAMNTVQSEGPEQQVVIAPVEKSMHISFCATQLATILPF